MTSEILIEPSAKAVIVEDGRILLLRYEDTSFDLGTWYSLPGGRQKFGSDLRETLRRECQEEIQADVDVRSLIGVREYIHANHELAGKGRDQHKIEFMFKCDLLSRPESTGDDADQEAIEWVSLDALSDATVFPTVLWDYLRPCFERKDGRWSWRALGDDLYWGDVY